MNDLTPQLKEMMENAQRVTLSRTEKDAMRAHIEAFVHANPKRGGLIPSPWLAGRFFTLMHKPVAMTLILILVLGGGTAYAAEGALPGDTLYSIKVNVVEEAVASVQVSDSAKAQWAAQRAERRLEEAVTLTDLGQMTDEKQAEIQMRFDTLAQAVEEHTKRIEKREGPRVAAAVLAEFEGKLRGHERALARGITVRPAVATRALKRETETDTEVAVKATAPVMMMAAISEESTSTADTAEIEVNISTSVDEEVEVTLLEVEAAAPIVKTVHARLKKLEQIRLGVELKEQGHENEFGE